MLTDEEAFQRMLDADPDDFATRAVFADWLEEMGDARAEGYRWMWQNGHRPGVPFGRIKGWVWFSEPLPAGGRMPYLPRSLFDLIPGKKTSDGSGREHQKVYRTRRAAEDALCKAIIASAVTAAGTRG